VLVTRLSVGLATLVVLLVSPGAGTPGPSEAEPVHGADCPAAPADTRHSDRLPDNVLAISVDGLNPRALVRLGRRGTPHLHAFLAAGASTLNARTSHEMTTTLPNHTGMVTGRRIDADDGGHGVTWNDDDHASSTVHDAAGEHVDSVFARVHAAGGSSALFAGKAKFRLWKRSWPHAIDHVHIGAHNGRVTKALVADLGTDREFRLLHLSRTDVVGHRDGFMSASYLRAVRRVDRLVGRVVRAVREDTGLRRHTTIVLTADHGGRGDRHDRAARRANYRIPFAVRGPGIEPGTDLYELNPDRRDPGTRRVGYGARRQPVRNSDLANLSLDLLGLAPVHGSQVNAGQDLDVAE
jgi:predicted AlkP superfamily pyrophosphatase or phosphodiesterase